MKQTIKNIIIAGCGLHFRERYYSVLQKMCSHRQIRILLVIDLVSQKETICQFFSGKQLVPEQFLFLPENFRNTITEADIDQQIEGMGIFNADAVIICTEPKVHKAYALWAIHHHLHVFTDKPLTAFQGTDICLYNDFQEIMKAADTHAVNFVMSCERRKHEGYEYIRRTIADLMDQYKVPITHIDIHFGGGKWNMPDEFFLRENHPYKYGYGVLLHSGYHYIDLLMYLLALNRSVFECNFYNCQLMTMSLTPADLLRTLGNDLHSRLLGTTRFEEIFSEDNMEVLQSFGETDVMLMGKFIHPGEQQSHFSIRLIETSVSNRNWHQLPDNDYLENGRMRQEYITIHMGPLCSIQVTSRSFSKKKTHDTPEEFTIEIINNVNITSRPQYTRIDRRELSAIYPDLPLQSSMNIKARQGQLEDFMNGGSGNADLSSHRYSILLMDKIFQQIRTQSQQMSYADK